MTIEALLRQQPSGSATAAPFSAALKATLQPLWTAFCLFAAKRIDLRERALKGCDMENQLIKKVVEANPLSEDLFDVDAVEEIFAQAERQAKSVASLLGFRTQFKRKRSSSRGQRTPKKQRGRGAHNQGHQGYRGQHHQQGTPQYGQQGYYTPSRGYPSTPRSRGGYRGKGRGGRSPGTPKTTPPAQNKSF